MKVNGVEVEDGLVIEANGGEDMAEISITVTDARLTRGRRVYNLRFGRTGLMMVETDDAVRVTMGNLALVPESANVVMIKPLS